MNTLTRLLIVVIFFIGSFDLVFAGGLPEPKVEFSADSIVETENFMMKSRVYHALNKERRELDMGGVKQVMIRRMDKNIVWMLMPDQNLYMELEIGDDALRGQGGEISYDHIDQEIVGEEVVDGMKTKKSEITVTDFTGTTFQGFMWTTPQGITVKMDTITKDKDSPFQMKMVLKNIKIEKQDPDLFEIPPGYSKMDLDLPLGGHGFDLEQMKP